MQESFRLPTKFSPTGLLSVEALRGQRSKVADISWASPPSDHSPLSLSSQYRSQDLLMPELYSLAMRVWASCGSPPSLFPYEQHGNVDSNDFRVYWIVYAFSCTNTYWAFIVDQALD